MLYQFAAKVNGKTFPFYTGQGRPSRLRQYIKLRSVKSSGWQPWLISFEGEKAAMWELLHKNGAHIFYR